MDTRITSKDQRHSVNLTTLKHTGTMPQDTVKQVLLIKLQVTAHELINHCVQIC
jgi:hypothetical protein